MLSSRSQKKNFVFPPEAIEILAWLKSVCLVNRDADVIRLALGTLTDLMLAIGRGDKIFIKSPDGSEKQYHPFLDMENKPASPPLDAIARYKRASAPVNEMENA